MSKHFLVEYRQIGSAEKREQLRPEHLEFRIGLASKISLAGPIMAEDGKPTGSLIILAAEDKPAAVAVAEQDPYVLNKVFSLVSVRPFRIAVINPLASE